MGKKYDKGFSDGYDIGWAQSNDVLRSVESSYRKSLELEKASRKYWKDTAEGLRLADKVREEYTIEPFWTRDIVNGLFIGAGIVAFIAIICECIFK